MGHARLRDGDCHGLRGRDLRRSTSRCPPPSSLAQNAFLWSGTIGTLILLVVYVLATIGMTLLVFVRRQMPSVPMWQVVIPIAGIIVLGYTLYRNVYPYPTGDGHWFPIVAGAWLAVAVIGVLLAPGTARKLAQALAAREGIRNEEDVIGL